MTNTYKQHSANNPERSFLAQVKPQKPTVRAQNKNTAYQYHAKKKKLKIVSEAQATAAYCPIYFNLRCRISRHAGQNCD